MSNWTATDWITAAIFASVAAIGLRYWLSFFKMPLLRRAQFLIDESAPARWGLLDVLIIVFVWISSQAFTMQILLWVFNLTPDQKLSADTLARFSAIVGLVQMVVMAMSLAYLSSRYHHAEHEFGLAKHQLVPGIRQGIIAFAMWVPIVWVVQTILVSFIEYKHPSFDRINESAWWRTIIDTWISAVIVAPIVEEILFRGIIQGWLQRLRKSEATNPNLIILGGGDAPVRTKKKSKRPLHLPAILVTSVLFGLAHFSQGPAPISLFVLSVGLGYLYQRTGSLVACIVVHMLLNGITMMLFTLDLTVL